MAKLIGFTLFDTAIGRCGIAWSGKGIAGTRLPEATAADMALRFPGAIELPPPPLVHDAINRIRHLLAGEHDDLGSIVLDFEGLSELYRRIYEITRAIPPGEVRTYGDIAKALGDPQLARAVGQAMGRNPCPIIVPCHRVLAAAGKTGGFTAPGGVDTKFRILAIEQAHQRQQNSLFDELPLAVKPSRSP